ncbi:Ankyrin [Reticulomyxa filosa]|uniref:Ankyrin n=1 Tax=Reticulomyxa filosa TaxID=46433 RepID=X6NK40_RETFI|nr:Ankyrin [Reticulomyxa filosa]|eukprot:ETO26680.1 Ankyrin [Reticulomyxa filosa]
MIADTEKSFDIAKVLLENIKVEITDNEIREVIEFVKERKYFGGPLNFCLAQKPPTKEEAERDPDKSDLLLKCAAMRRMAELLLRARIQNVNARDHINETCLHKCARNGYYELVRLLVYKYKIDIQLVNDNDMNAFHVAALEQHVQIVNLLLKEKIDIGIPTKEYGNHVLVHAARLHHTNLVKLMIQLGADFNARDDVVEYYFFFFGSFF